MRNLILVIVCIGIFALGIDIFSSGEDDSIPRDKVKTSRVRPIQAADAKEKEDVDLFATEKPILIYFYVTWCGGCRRFNPYWERTVAQYSDKFRCIKVNIDEPKYSRLAREFKVRSIPQVWIYDKANKRRQKCRNLLDLSRELDDYYSRFVKL